MVAYPDSSFLVALYITEANSFTARRYMSAQTEPICYTPFHRLEVRTALRLRAFRGENPLSEVKAALRKINEDLVLGLLHHTPLIWNDALREAERIGESSIAEIGARSFDLFHVASALVLGAGEFLTFDQRQTKLAQRAGVKIKSWSTR